MVLHSNERRGGGGGAGAGSSGSSIALLQERFRQLEKMREKRQEMELLKRFPESGTISRSSQVINRYEPPVRSLVHHELMLTRPSSHNSVSLGLGLDTKQEEPQKDARNTQVMDFWKVDPNKHEVDTSLHL